MKRARQVSRRPAKDVVHGEGNYEAARRFNQAERDFVASGKAASAARNAAPRSDREARELQDAERKGRARAKEEDTALTRATDLPPQRGGSGRTAKSPRKRSAG